MHGDGYKGKTNKCDCSNMFLQEIYKINVEEKRQKENLPQGPASLCL